MTVHIAFKLYHKMGRLESSKRWALVSNINNKIALQLSSEYNAKGKYKSYLDEHCLYPM